MQAPKVSAPDFIRAYQNSPLLGHTEESKPFNLLDTLKRTEESLFSFLHEVQIDTGVNLIWLYLLLLFNFIQLLHFPLSQSKVMPWVNEDLMRNVYVVLSPITFTASSIKDPGLAIVLFFVACAWTGLLAGLLAWGTFLWSSDALGGGYRPSWLPKILRVRIFLSPSSYYYFFFALTPSFYSLLHGTNIITLL